MMSQEWITGLLGTLAVLGFLIREYTMVILCVVLLLVRYASHLWTAWSAEHLTYKRELSSHRIWPGEAVRLTVEIENDTILPVPFLECQDEFPEGLTVDKGRVLGHHKARRRMLYNLLSMRWYERVRRHYRVTGDHRGRFVFGPVDLRTGDLLGFASHTGRREATTELLVYPRIYAVDELPIAWRSPSGPKTIRSWLLEDPTLYGGARDYTPTDPFNRIDWKASARSQALKVRVFDASVDRALLVALNLSTHDFPWQGIDVDLLEWSISVAASVASAALIAGQSVGLVTNHFQVDVVETGRGPEQYTRVFDTLAALDVYTTWPTPGIVARALCHARAGDSLVLVTPRLNDPLVTELQALKRASGLRNVVIFTGSEAPVELGDIELVWMPKGGSGDEIARLG